MDESRWIVLPVVLGPTGSGKSALGLRIAREFGGEIVSCDSLQVYRGFDIGTAKVPEPDREGIPHHLIDLVEPAESFTAGQYAREGRAVLGEIAARGKMPVVVGGTGLYLRALLEGLFQGPERDEAIRRRLQRREQQSPGSLHRLLARLDPVAASRIHKNDQNKTIRALEVRLLEGRPLSDLFSRGRSPLSGFRPVKIGLEPPRELLYRRLDERSAEIFARGLIAEVRDLLASGLRSDAKPFESLGYHQAVQVVRGAVTAEQAIESTRIETRHYAKRQITWFRKEHDVRWLKGFGDEPHVQARALEIIQTARNS